MGRLLLILAFPFLGALSAPLAASAGPDCRCRSNNGFFNQGDIACIHTNQGLKLARCDMSQNVTTWTVVGDSCPQALMTPLPPGRLAFAAMDMIDPDRR